MDKETIEQLIRSFGWYVKVATAIGHCVLDKDDTKTCLDALKGLYEGNARLHEAYTELARKCASLTEENEMLRNAFSRYEEYKGMKLLKAETVRKFAKRVKEGFNIDSEFKSFFGEETIFKIVDQTEKEMLEGAGDGNT